MSVTNLPYPKIRQVPIESGGRPVFELLESFEFSMRMGKHGAYTFHKPQGALTDFGSVPRLLWWFVNPLDMRFSVSWLIHDDMFENCCPRVQADSMQLVVASHYGATPWKRLCVYTVLRALSWTAWPSKGIEDRRKEVVAAIRSGPHEE